MKTSSEYAFQSKGKNRNMLLIIAVLVLMVAISSIFLGTLSKYIVSDSSSDEASVAKFGINVPNTINLFSESYTNVQSDQPGKKVIAPGTFGMHKFKVTGTSEVAYVVSAVVAVNYSDEWDGYKPLEFSINGSDWTTYELFQTNLANALKSNVMAPNTAYENNQTIYWRWPFSVSEENDVKDTAMARLSAAGTAPKVTVDFEVTATQVDG